MAHKETKFFEIKPILSVEEGSPVSIGLLDFVKSLTEILASIPAEFQGSAFLELRCHGEYSSAEIDGQWSRPETDDEMNKRIGKIRDASEKRRKATADRNARRAEKKEAHDKLEFERLKKKFNASETK